MSARKRKRNNDAKYSSDYTIELEILGVFLLALSVLLSISLFFPQTSGQIGQYLSLVLKRTLGLMSVLLPLYLGLIAIGLIAKVELKIKIDRSIIGFFLFLITLFPFLHLIFSEDVSWVSFQNLAQEGKGGGIVGAYLLSFIVYAFDKWGAYVILIALLLIATSLIFTNFISRITLLVQKMVQTLWVNKDKVLRVAKDIGRNLKVLGSNLKENILVKLKSNRTPVIVDEEVEVSGEDKDVALIPKDESADVLLEVKEKKEIGVPPEPFSSSKKSPKPPKFLEEKQLKLPIYQLPPLNLLKVEPQSSYQEKIVQEQKEKIIQTLLSFGIEAYMVAINTGPRITRYELQPAAGIKVREIVNLADDLALHLAAAPIRVEAPIPGKSAIGVEVPNRSKSIVYIKELLEEIPVFETAKPKLLFALGEDIAGGHKVADLSKMPHLLIAGATGSGKSVCLNSLIASFLFKAKPNDLKFLLIDPKRVELTVYNGIPHLFSPVVVDAKEAAMILELMVKIMEERYDYFAETGVRNIQGYNERVKPEEKMPYILVIIDELADLMFQSSLEVEKNICRIAQLARATGIHLIIATQRPSVNVITGLIKANIPSRISFAVASQTDSRTILDMNGAEKLLGEGDMLFLPIEESKPTRLQGAFISESEIKKVVEFWRKQGEPEYDSRFLGLAPKDAKHGEDIEVDDELYKKAIEIILTSNQASASLLQRKLKIGYARAGRLIDLMEKQGIVGPLEGSKPREILVGLDYLERLDNLE